MKRETTFLIAIALLVNAIPVSWAQDDELSDQDLQTLLEEKPADSEMSAKSEVNTPAPEAPADYPGSDCATAYEALFKASESFGTESRNDERIHEGEYK